MDEMYLFISKGGIKPGLLLKLSQYINVEEYDTDSLTTDIEAHPVGNIDKNFGSKILVENIRQFIKATTGYIIFYISNPN